ncbi:hypothetical protein ACTMU2_32885 [Cupriavidus basilensis]
MLAMAAAVFAMAGCGKKETPKEQQPAAQAPAAAPATTAEAPVPAKENPAGGSQCAGRRGVGTGVGNDRAVRQEAQHPGHLRR